MLAHVVLLALKSDLPMDDRAALVRAFEVAIREIPSVRSVRVGRRIQHDAGYESQAPDAEYLAVLDFEDLEGLRAYLRHPAHAALGEFLGRACRWTQICDFEVQPQEGMNAWLASNVARP